MKSSEYGGDDGQPQPFPHSLTAAEQLKEMYAQDPAGEDDA